MKIFGLMVVASFSLQKLVSQWNHIKTGCCETIRRYQTERFKQNTSFQATF